MKHSALQRISTELLVIVLGVLIALWVDDWRQTRAEEALQRQLVSRMATELTADGADLANGDYVIRARLWVIEAATASSTEGSRVPQARLDSLRNPFRADSLRAASGISPVVRLDLVHDPLSAFRSWPDFDLSDGAYQEMLANGSFSVVEDETTRGEILSYYRWARSQEENESRAGAYQDDLEASLATAGLVTADTIPLDQLAVLVAGERELGVALRRARSRILLQLRYLRTIERERLRLENVLSDALRGAS